MHIVNPVTYLRQLPIAYQDFVIVLPGVVNNLPQYFEDFCSGKKSTEANSQITIDYPPVEHLQPKQKDTAFQKHKICKI